MAVFWESKNRFDPLSVEVLLGILFTYFSVFASLVILTHVSQLLNIPFRSYSYLCAGIGSLVAVAAIIGSIKQVQRCHPKDYINLAMLLFVAFVGVFLALSYHRVGRISPDEYYYAANPVYYTQHPDLKMGFESWLFFSRNVVHSVAYLTAGAYEYVEAAFSFLSNIQFEKVYYLLGAGSTGFLIPIAIFLLIYCFSGNASGSILGAFVTISTITLMGETSWAPGANSFLRAFEGKALLQFAGVPLLTAFSIIYFIKQSLISWLRLLALCVALSGTSTSAFAIVPILGAIICLAYLLASGKTIVLNREFILRIGLYFIAFTYLAFWAIYVARNDGIKEALFFNSDYPSTLSGYVSGYIYPPFPLTPILAISACLAALAFAKGMSRKVLFFWIALVLLTVLNPLVAPMWLQYFKGIYYRLFYLLPFPVSVGFLTAFLFVLTKSIRPLLRCLLVIATCGVFVVLPFVVPVSIFRLNLYAQGNALTDPEMLRASEIVSTVPKGVMLAPWPLSGAISMLQSNTPQMLTRADILQFYLGLQGQEQDSLLRLRVQSVLDGNDDGVDSIAQLLDNYPEIMSIVIYKQVYLKDQELLQPAFAMHGFADRKVIPLGILVFSK